MQIEEQIRKFLEYALSCSQCGTVFVDIDHSQQINEFYGHQICDEVIENVERIVDDIVNMEKSMIARAAGDKFLIVLPNEYASSTTEIANTIRERVASEPLTIRGQKIDISVSIGGFIFNNVSNDSGISKTEWLKELVEFSCLYAKFSGRGKVVIIDAR